MGELLQLEKQRREFIDEFDKLSPYTDRMIERDIEKYRKGLFCIRVVDEKGQPVENAIVHAKLKRHEFKFGSTPFMVGMYDDPDKQKKWEEEYANIFNYTVCPIFWMEYEPEEGRYRFDKGAPPKMYRRPPLDEVMEFADKYDLKVKAHCLVYHTDTPDWAPVDRREYKIKLENYAKALSDRYGDRFVDMDVINELCWISKNHYPESYSPSWPRNMSICDEEDHIAWAFELAKKYFPKAKHYWNEANWHTFGFKGFHGRRSPRYLELKNALLEGVKVEGIGIQCHLWEEVGKPEDMLCAFNPLRLMEVFKVYSDFKLPMQISEISLPTYSLDPESEEIQAELTKRLYKLWFSTEMMEGIVWWNLADGTSPYAWGNIKKSNLLREDLSRKPSYTMVEKLIKEEWHTDEEKKTAKDGRIFFEGFYGDYEIEVSTDGKHYKEVRPMGKNETGYHHETVGYRDYNLRETKVVLK